MLLSKIIKKYFFDSKKTILINFIIFITCLTYVVLTNISNNNKLTKATYVNIENFPPFLVKGFGSSLYELDINLYQSSNNDNEKLRNIRLSWDRGSKDIDLEKFESIKNKIEIISNRFISLAQNRIVRINKDYDNCMIYLYSEQYEVPYQIIELEANINYINWFLENKEKYLSLERTEIKFFSNHNVLDVIFSVLFLTFLFSLLVNFVRVQRKKL
tara:strand:+ start:406 stop:1050 length:645 start_codon:yes stop_codon:yes gene_type:complete